MCFLVIKRRFGWDVSSAVCLYGLMGVVFNYFCGSLFWLEKFLLEMVHC